MSSKGEIVACLDGSTSAADFASFSRTVQQPLKIPFLAAIIIGVNAQRPELVAQLLTRSGTTVESYMKSGEWREVKLVLRLLACLQCLFNSDGIFTVLDELFSRAVTLQTTSSEDVSSFFVPIFMAFANFDVSLCTSHSASSSSKLSFSRSRMS